MNLYLIKETKKFVIQVTFVCVCVLLFELTDDGILKTQVGELCPVVPGCLTQTQVSGMNL